MSCETPTIDLCIKERTSFRKRFVWKPGGVPADLTGYTAHAQIRAKAKSPTILLDLSDANGRIEFDADRTTGGYSFVLSADDTVNKLKGVYDLYFTAPDGTEIKQQAGEVSYETSVTKPTV